MSFTDAVRVLFGRPTLEEAERLEKQELAEANMLREQSAVAQIMDYPIIKLSKSDFSALPGADEKEVSRNFLETCPIGTRFVCRSRFEGIIVVGQVVKGDDLFCSQWGSGLATPKRGINRYRVQLI